MSAVPVFSGRTIERARTRLRALLLTLDHAPTTGGIQTMAAQLLASSDGIDWTVVAPAEGDHDTHDRASSTRIRRARRLGPGRRGFIPGVALAARREIRRERPDVVVAMHVLAAPAAILAGVPVVVVCHGGELRSRRIRRIARWVLPRASRVVANSRFTRSEALALGADPMRTSVALVGAPEPVAVPPAAIAAVRERVGGARTILSVARLEAHKGHDHLIRSLADLPADVHLAIVGRGSAEAGLRAVALEAGVADRVVFAGFVPDDELPVWFAAADCFALLSRETDGAVEGGGIAILEACAYGVPVVAGASGGIPETIRDGVTGLLVQPDDGIAIARALGRVLEDAELAGRLATSARAMARGERSWARFAERVGTVMERAADREGVR